MADHLRKSGYGVWKRVLWGGALLLCAAIFVGAAIVGVRYVFPADETVVSTDGTSSDPADGTPAEGAPADSTSVKNTSTTAAVGSATASGGTSGSTGTTTRDGTATGSEATTKTENSTPSADGEADERTQPRTESTVSSVTAGTVVTTATATTTVKKPTTTTKKSTTATTETPSIGSTDTELRAVWVSYIELAGWLYSPASARTNIDALMDFCVKYNLNTVFLHVRANSDAFYESRYFPVAAQAKAVIAAGFDPLEYAVKAAHSRGIALHAWVNPYRVGTTLENARCDDVFSYGGQYYYVPSSSAAREQIRNGVRELVEDYAVDGVHFDDYFYPEGAVDAGVLAAFEKADYAASGGTQAVDDWRRAQVTALLRDVYRIVHASGKEFGVSPVAELPKNYNEKYADVEAWIASADVVDYICPQIYYGLQHGTRPFAAVVDEWVALPRHASVKLYVGLAVYKAGMAEDKWAGSGKYEWANGGDILAQELAVLKNRTGTDGFALYSYSYLFPDRFTSEVNGGMPIASVAKNELSSLLTALKNYRE